MGVKRGHSCFHITTHKFRSSLLSCWTHHFLHWRVFSSNSRITGGLNAKYQVYSCSVLRHPYYLWIGTDFTFAYCSSVIYDEPDKGTYNHHPLRYGLSAQHHCLYFLLLTVFLTQKGNRQVSESSVHGALT